MTDKQVSLSVSQTFVLLMPSELTRVCVYRGFIYGCRFSVAAPYQGKSKIAAPATFHGLIEGEKVLRPRTPTARSAGRFRIYDVTLHENYWPRKESRMIESRNDDLNYLAWTTAHPNGFVLNVRRSPDSNYVVLHRASCKSISNEKQKPDAFTGRNYRKICAATVAELQAAAINEGRRDGSFSKRCSLCDRELLESPNPPRRLAFGAR